MIKHIKDYVSDFERDLNIPLMTKEADAPLVDYVVDSWKSLCIIQNIQFLGYEYTETESEIDINKYVFKREKKTPKKDKFDYKFVDDTRAGKLTVEMLISSVDRDPKTKKPVTHQKIIKKSMLIPLLDEHGMAYIKGKKYYLIYQMVEKSTYTSANGVILKSLMPFAIRRTSSVIEDMSENVYTVPIYNIELYKKDIPIMLIYASNGLSFAIQYALDTAYAVMDFVTSYDKEDKTNLYFQISSKLFLRVNKKLFDNYTYVQSVVGGVLKICTNRLTIDKIDDTDIWLKKLSNNNIEKGKNLIISLQRLMDETTRKMLKVNVYRKLDVVSVIKYMTENYNDLRAKDNMNLCNKRLRCNEYIASLLTQEFSKRLNRIMSLGNKATIDNYKEMFKFSGDLLIQKMHSSGILRFCDAINDLDFFSKFKYTRFLLVQNTAKYWTNLSNWRGNLVRS